MAVTAPIYEQQADDLRAVLDAAGAERVALLGSSEAGRVAAIFAATYPERISSLALFGVATRGSAVLTTEYLEQVLALVENSWGSGGTLDFYAPSLAGTPTSGAGTASTSAQRAARAWPGS